MPNLRGPLARPGTGTARQQVHAIVIVGQIFLHNLSHGTDAILCSTCKLAWGPLRLKQACSKHFKSITIKHNAPDWDEARTIAVPKLVYWCTSSDMLWLIMCRNDTCSCTIIFAPLYCRAAVMTCALEFAAFERWHNDQQAILAEVQHKHMCLGQHEGRMNCLRLRAQQCCSTASATISGVRQGQAHCGTHAPVLEPAPDMLKASLDFQAAIGNSHCPSDSRSCLLQLYS